MKRYISLDVLRGITVAFMCIVNNPGSWSHIFPPLAHAGWDGCTPTDLVYPFFIFCMGCAMAFSFAKYDSLQKDALVKILKRGVLLFLIGLLLNMFPFFPRVPHDHDAGFWQNWLWWLGHVRIFGVLQRIALAYIIAGVLALWLRKPGKIMIAICVLSVVYTGILVTFGTEPGPFTLDGNVSGKVDVALVGADHVYHGYRLESGERADFDPEGLLGAMMAACSALLGYLIGGVIYRSSKKQAALSGASGIGNAGIAESSPSYILCRIFAYGLVSLALSQVLSIWIPVNKPLWSVSYVFYAGGWAMLALAFLAFVIDVKGHGKPFEPFRAMGTNALVAFVLCALIVKTLSLFGFSASRYFGANEYMSLLWALIFMSVIFFIQWILYKKKIVIKL